MSSKDPRTQAAKFLAQLKVLETERLALYEELLDPESQSLRDLFDQYKVEYATSQRQIRSLRKEVAELRRIMEAAGLTAESPMASTKNQIKNALFTARKKLKRAMQRPPGSYPAEHSELVREALAELEKIV